MGHRPPVREGFPTVDPRAGSEEEEEEDDDGAVMAKTITTKAITMLATLVVLGQIKRPRQTGRLFLFRQIALISRANKYLAEEDGANSDLSGRGRAGWVLRAWAEPVR